MLIFRRHSPINPAIEGSGCKVQYAGLQKDKKLRTKSMKILTGKQKKKYLDCDCQLWASGPGILPYSLKTNDMAVALAKVNRTVADAKDVTVFGDRLEDTIQNFLDYQGTKVKGVVTEIKDEKGKLTGNHYTNTLGNYDRLLRGRLLPFMAERNVHHAPGLTVPLLDKFINTGLSDVEDSSRETMVKLLRRFLKKTYMANATHSPTSITIPLHSYIEATPAKREQTEPYTREELAAIREAAGNLNDNSFYGSDGPRFQIICDFLVETGLRRSDTVRFLPSKLVPKMSKDGKTLESYRYTFQPMKNGRSKTKWVTTYISPELKERIDECKWMSEDRPFAHSRVDLKVEANDTTAAMGGHLGSRFEVIGQITGIENCIAHRMRDTFAIIFLVEGGANGTGGTMQELSIALGHSSLATTEQSYNPQSLERDDMLASMMAALMQKRRLAIAA